MSFKDFFLHSGKELPADAVPLSEDEERVMNSLAAKVVEWRMTVPAILFLESVKPLNFIGAQAMVFFEPFVQTIFNLKDYDTCREMFERRENVERLLLRIEELDAIALQKEKAARKERKSGEKGFFYRIFRKSSPKSSTENSAKNDSE